jgi:hypothetical protein
MSKITYYLILTLFFVSCAEKPKKPKIKFWYSFHSHTDKEHSSDTFEIDQIKQGNGDHSLIAREGFSYKDKGFGISMFTNEPNAPIDGGIIYYELNHLGVIYSRSTTWFSYSVLKSNNDSINDLINVAIQNILLSDKLRCFDISTLHKYKKEVDIIPSLP